MFTRLIFLLILVFSFSTFKLITLPDNYVNNELNQKNLNSFINLDSLSKLINKNGWNLDIIESYQHALLNFPYSEDQEILRLQYLPGTYEKSFLQAIILKRKMNFEKMFDSLAAGLNFRPNFYSFFDELAFSANASDRNSVLKNLITNSNQINQAQKYYLNGLLLFYQSKQEEALAFLLKADSLNPKNKNILYAISQVYKSLSDYKNSLLVLKKLKAEHGNDIFLRPKLLLAEGILSYFSNDYKNAEKLFEDALSFADKSGDKISMSKAYTDLGICADNNSNIELARQFFIKGIEIAEEVNDVESIAFGNAELGVSYTFTNELIDAKKHYLKSYKLYEEIRNFIRLALLSNNLGKLYMNFFDYKSALKYFEEGIKYAGEDKRAKVLNLIGMADVYANLSNYAKALKYYGQAKRLSAEMKEYFLQAEINTGLAALNFNLNKFNNANYYYQIALENLKEKPNVYYESDINHKIGLTYFRMDSLEAAEEFFKRAINSAKSSKNEFLSALTYGDLADLYFTKKEFTKAIELLKKCKEIAKRNNWSYLIAEYEILEGDINANQNLFLPAKQHYQNALKIADELNNGNLKILSYNSLGKLFYKNGFNEGAESFYKSAISLVETTSKPLFQDSEVQIEYFNTRRELYDNYTQLLLTQQKYEDAFELIDKSRSRNTLQNLLHSKLASLTYETEKVEKIYEVEWMINSGIYDKDEADSLKIILNDNINYLTNRYPTLRNQLINSNNGTLLINLKDLLAENEYFISFYSTDDNSYLFLVSNDTLEVIKLNLTREKINEMVSKVSPFFDERFRTEYFFNKDLFAFNSKYSYELYKELFQPALEIVPKNSQLIISVSPELAIFPLEFLITSFDSSESSYNYHNQSFLILDYAISYTPSASIYLELKNSKVDGNRDALIVGNPAINYNSDDYSERRGLLDETISNPRNVALLPLRYSGEEVEMIAEIIGSNKLFLSNKATETNFKQHAEQSKVIHLSTHSFLHQNQPLIFFSNLDDAENDGFLEASEIVQMNLNAELVVLSSCASGLGRVDESEGVIGMAKAFFDAGSKSIVVSLWEVNDKYTSKLMTNFYEKLNEGYTKSEALRLAKIEFIKNHSPNPYYWAAFVLSGNTSEIKFETTSKITAILVLSSIFLLFTLIIYSIRTRRNFKLFQ